LTRVPRLWNRSRFDETSVRPRWSELLDRSRWPPRRRLVDVDRPAPRFVHVRL